MNWSRYISFVALVFVLLLHPFGFAPSVMQADASSREVCFDDWSAAGPVVRAENLKPVDRVLGLVAKQRKGKAVKVRLCRRDGKFRYRVAVAGANGGISWVSVDARTGRIQPLARP